MDFIADCLLQLSSWFHRASVACKDAALAVILYGRRRRK